MRRGFKAEAERLAEKVRKRDGEASHRPLDALELARHVGADVRCADELTSLEKLETLEELQPGAFSACTFTVGDRHVIVYSPLGVRRADAERHCARGRAHTFWRTA